jgi:hypothetical protein
MVVISRTQVTHGERSRRERSSKGELLMDFSHVAVEFRRLKAQYDAGR